MLKEMVASQTAKLIAACVCPVVGATALTMSVPKVRSAVHRATEPKRVAHAKPRVRIPLGERGPALAAAAPFVCPEVTPIVFANAPLTNGVANNNGPQALALGPDLPTRVASAGSPGGSVFTPGNPGGFATNPGGGGGDTGGPGGTVTTPPAVPEPATWVQMIVGFGVVGGATRVSWRQNRRRRAAA